MARRACVAALFAALLIGPGDASAQAGFYVGGGLGPAVRVDDWPTQFRIEEEVGYFIEDRPSGFFLAFAPSQSFASDYWLLTFAPRFGWLFDLYRGRDVGFQLGPTVTIPGIAIGNFFGVDRDVDAYFHFAVSFAVRLLLDAGHVAVYLRPLEFEFGFGDGHLPFTDDSGTRYVLTVGVQYHP